MNTNYEIYTIDTTEELASKNWCTIMREIEKFLGLNYFTDVSLWAAKSFPWVGVSVVRRASTGAINLSGSRNAPLGYERITYAEMKYRMSRDTFIQDYSFREELL